MLAARIVSVSTVLLMTFMVMVWHASFTGRALRTLARPGAGVVVSLLPLVAHVWVCMTLSDRFFHRYMHTQL